jgi:hypothetical protein
MTRLHWAGLMLAALMLFLAVWPAKSDYAGGHVVTIQIGQGRCSAVHIGGGTFLTAKHCFNPRLTRLSHLEVSMVGLDHRIVLRSRYGDTDIATLQVDDLPLDFPVARPRCDIPRAGEPVTMIGNPRRMGMIAVPGTVIHGAAKVGHLHPVMPKRAIALSAGLGRGMSGGAVIDAAGRLIGINSGVVDHIAIAARVHDLPACASERMAAGE